MPVPRAPAASHGQADKVTLLIEVTWARHGSHGANELEADPSRPRNRKEGNEKRYLLYGSGDRNIKLEAELTLPVEPW